MTRQIAFIEDGDSDSIQKLMVAKAAEWRKAGIRVAGLTAEPQHLPDHYCSAGFLCDIDSGERFRIYRDEATAGTSCHLDGDGVATACAALLPRLADSDLVILSKFGKLEAEGKGLYPAFEAARAAGKPVLTTIGSKHHEAWNQYAPEAVRLAPSKDALSAWLSA